MSYEREVDRISGWGDSGVVQCRGCGRQIRLYFNGGELDRKSCCGYIYQTEHQTIDLVILREPAWTQEAKTGHGDADAL